MVQADGGTRCAAITGGFIALAGALRVLRRRGALPALPLRDFVAAASVGMVGGHAVLDLNYAEDASAEVDMNVVMTGRGGFVELQGTAERAPFDEGQMTALLALAQNGINALIAMQKVILKEKAEALKRRYKEMTGSRMTKCASYTNSIQPFLKK